MGELADAYETEFFRDLNRTRDPPWIIQPWKTYNSFAEYKLGNPIPQDTKNNWKTCNAGMRVIPRSAFEKSNVKKTAELMYSLSDQFGGCGGFYHIGGAGYDNALKHPGATYVNPMVRNGIFILNINNKKDNDEWLNKGWTGTSINHQNWNEVNWTENAWGQDHYNELLKKKAEFDPKKRFHCRRCVG